jgi:biopolymer transport protein ExbD
MDIPVRSQHASLNLTPLLDMVFLLLMFFFLTTQFIQDDGINMRLPEASSAMEQDRDHITVSLTAQGDMYLNGQPLAMDDLEPGLRALMGSNTTVVLRADRSVHLQNAVGIMEQAQRAGASRIMVATDQETGP